MKKQTHPSEIISAIEQKYPDIEVIDTITEGLSGAVVLLGHIHSSRSAGYQGIAFIKVDTRDRCQQEYNSHQHSQNPCNKEYIPSILTQPEPLFDDKYMIRYEPAHHVNLSARSLGNLIEANDLPVAFISGQIHNLLGNVLNCWQHPHDLIQNRHAESVSNLLQILFNIGGKDRTSDLQDRADLWGLPGQNDRLLTFRPGVNIELPNPIAYILDASLWTNVQRIAIPTTAMHGDLHGGNIICDVNDAHSTPWLIDFAVFINDGMPFFDLAYLELDTLLRSLPSTSQGSESAWKDWVTLTEFITGEVMPAGEPSRRNTLPAWQLIKPIREHIHAILKHVEPHPGLKHDFEIAWWCAMVVVGTLFTRRSRVRDREYRIVSLLFAARSLDRLIQLTGAPKEENIAAEVWWREPPYQGSPFPGLKAFTPDQAPIFYGRTREIKELAGIFENEDLRFLLVAGASGSGKSSLVDAGLIPHLKRHPVHNSNQWHRVRFTPDEDPFASMRAALMEVFPGEQQLASRIRENSSVLDELCEKHLGDDSEILLFVDQFEELFTLATESTIEPFVQFLAQVPMMKRVRAIATMRNDFYPNCFKYPDLLSLIQRRDYKLGAPGYRALHEMIKRPADKANVTFDDGLIDKILEETGTDPGALALMAYTMEKLYESAKQTKRSVTWEMYEEIEGVQGAIKAQAQRTLESLSEEAQKALYRVFRDLVSIEGGVAIRQRALAKNFTTKSEIEFIKAFLSARLLMADRAEDGQPTLEVAHEALLRSWPRLADWIEDTQDDLRRLRELRGAVAEWKRQKKAEPYRWKHERLEPVYRTIERLDVKFNDPDYDEFLRPEADRLLEEFLKYQDVGMAGATYEQRKIADRLVEIGPAAVPAMLVAYEHSTGTSSRQVFEKAILSLPRERLGAHVIDMLLSQSDKIKAIADEYVASEHSFKIIDHIEKLLKGDDVDRNKAMRLIEIMKLDQFAPHLLAELSRLPLASRERDQIVRILSTFDRTALTDLLSELENVPPEIVTYVSSERVAELVKRGAIGREAYKRLMEYTAPNGPKSAQRNFLQLAEYFDWEVVPTTIWKPASWWKGTKLDKAAIELVRERARNDIELSKIVKWLATAQPALALEAIQARYRGANQIPVAIIEILNQAAHDKVNTPHIEGRAAAWRVIGSLDTDARKGVGTVTVMVKSKKFEIPDIDWVHIPPSVNVSMPYMQKGFFIARYPITYKQYQSFVIAGGYKDDRWWNHLSYYAGSSRRLKSQKFRYWNHPRERVSWYEAMAFCKWLDFLLHQLTDTQHVPVGLTSLDNWQVRLPHESEWEHVARGPNGRVYPWGETFSNNRANVAVRPNLDQTTAVGIYPNGNTPEGVADLSGNVWEWCYNQFSGTGDRVLRGGSWDSTSDRVRTKSRHHIPPHDRFSDVGFRIVAAIYSSSRSFQ